MGNMEVRKVLQKEASFTFKKLNDAYISMNVIIPSLDKGRIEIEKLSKDKFKFSVPSNTKNKIRELPRTKERYLQILNNAISYELYKYFIITSTSIVEDYIVSVLKILFNEDKRKLLFNAQGIEIEKTILLTEIIFSKNKEEILDQKIEQHINNLLYQEPKKLFDYLENVFQIQIDSTEINAFCELKATRDLLIHNNGIINKIYLSKAKDFSRGELQDKIILDEEYISTCLICCKKLVGRINRDSRKKFSTMLPNDD